MSRWAACPGSIKASEGIPRKSSKYADEGTDAHSLAATCLNTRIPPSEWVGRTFWRDDTDQGKFEVTQEMADAVEVYFEFVMFSWEVGDVDHVEVTLDALAKVHPDMGGTSDFARWRPSTRRLTVVDYKHGAGIPVDVRDNPQLMTYALGAMLQLGYRPKIVELVIVQPRCFHADGPVRSVTLDAVELLDFAIDAASFAKATEAREAPLVPGDHCHFCPAAAVCPALADRALEAARTDFLPTLSYDPEKLRLALDSREAIKAWLKAVDEFAYSEAEAGRCPPGYKLVAKRANRRWCGEGEVVDRLQEAGVDASVIWERSVRSVAQIEKALGKKDFAAYADLVAKESSGHALAPESDPRPPVKADAADDFAGVFLPNGTDGNYGNR